MPGNLITVEEAGKRLGISRTTAYELARSADFPAFRIGHRIIVSESGLDDWIQKQIENKQEEFSK